MAELQGSPDFLNHVLFPFPLAQMASFLWTCYRSASSGKLISPQASGRASSVVGVGTPRGNFTSTGAVVVNVPQGRENPSFIL